MRYLNAYSVNPLTSITWQWWLRLPALKDEDFIEKSRIANKAGIAQLEAGFKALGLNYVPSRANFILVDVEADPGQTFNALLKEGVIVRPVGITTHLRISIGTEAENAKFLCALARSIGQGSKGIKHGATIV